MKGKTAGRLFPPAAYNMKCKMERIRHDLESLAEFNMTPGDGCTRLSYTKEFSLARDYIRNEMEAAGLKVREDAAGNLIGRYPGKMDKPVIMTGSHFDTVFHGGNFDGQAGVCAAIEVARVLGENNFTPCHPIDFIAMPEEEGARFGGGLFGSRAICNGVSTDELKTLKDADGVSLYQALENYGLNPDEIGNARIRPDDITAFIELHIEQGPVLEQNGKDIGIVDAIVSLEGFDILIKGRADHAGSTPMAMRADALLAAAKSISAATDKAVACGDGTVVTFGCIKSVPESANVVPSEVRFTADCRSPYVTSIGSVMETFEESLQESAKAFPDLSFEIKRNLQAEPAMMDETLKKLIEEAADELSLSSMHLLSGAGHDTMNFKGVCPLAMIFVPSRGGRSHCPQEWTDYRQVSDGADVLLRTVVKAASR